MLAAAIAVAAAVLIGGFAWLNARSAPDAAARPGVDAIWAEANTGIGGEAFPALAWTGSEVIVLRTENGGSDVTGERWNPETNLARPIADSDLVWRVGAATAWTGDELLVVGGSNGPGLDRIGAGYDPAADSWRPLADPPGTVDGGENAILGPGVWTGRELIIWRSGLAYDPETDTWREIARSPLSPRLRPVTVWTGSELVVWGGCHRERGQCDESNSGLLGDGARYDPAADEWTSLPPAPLAPAVHMVAGWTGSDVIIVTTAPGPVTGARAAAFDPDTDRWTEIATP